MAHGRHQIAGLRVSVDHAMGLAEQAAVDRVDERVAATELRVLEKGRRQHRLAAGRERHVHRVVHAAGDHRLDQRLARPPAEDVRGACHQRRLARPLVRLLGKRALGPVDPPVGPQIRAVEIVGAPGQRLAGEPLFALIRHAVVVGVGELPDAGRSAHVQRPVEPHRALRQHHAVRKDDAGVEDAVAVLVLEPHDPVRAVGELLLDFVVGAGGIRDVQPPLFVEVRDDGPIDQWGPRDPHDLEAGRHGELRLRWQGALGGWKGQRQQRPRENGSSAG